MDQFDLLGHCAYFLIFTGMFLLGKRIIWGWPIKAGGDLLWLYIGIKVGMTSIWLWEIGFLSAAVYGFWEWFRKKENDTSSTDRV